MRMAFTKISLKLFSRPRAHCRQDDGVALFADKMTAARSPAMICRMTFFNGDEQPAARRADFIVSDEFGFDRRAVFARFDDARFYMNQFIERRRAQKFD